MCHEARVAMQHGITHLGSKVLIAIWPWPHVEAVGHTIKGDVHDSGRISSRGRGQGSPPVWEQSSAEVAVCLPPAFRHWVRKGVALSCQANSKVQGHVS